MTEDQIRELFKEMRDEPVPPDSLARVRVGVADRTATAHRTATVRERSFAWLTALATAAVAAAVVAFFAWTRTPSPEPVQPAPVVAANWSIPLELPAPPAIFVRRDPPRLPLTMASIAPALLEPVSPQAGTVIRIETPDPDVVILLIGD